MTTLVPFYAAERLAALRLANLVRSRLGLAAQSDLAPATSTWGDRSISCPISATICAGEDLIEAQVGTTGVIVRDLYVDPLNPHGWRSELMRIDGDEIEPDALAFIELSDQGLLDDLNP